MVGADAVCECCGAEWDFFGAGLVVRHFGCELHVRDGDRFISWSPCCEWNRFVVETEGFEAAHGRTLESVVQDLDPGSDILEVTADDSTIVARLVTRSPMQPKGTPNRAGIDSAKSPSGWRDQCFAFVDAHHRHHDAPVGHKFSVAVYNGSVRVGVAVVGRPVSRMLAKNEPQTLEVTRVCTHGHRALTKNASSKLYSTCCKEAKKLGATKLITYTIYEVESGHSLIASGWVPVAITTGGSWSRQGREREDKAPTGAKVRWEKGLTKSMRKAVEANRIDVASRGLGDCELERLVNAMALVERCTTPDLASYLEMDTDRVRALFVELYALGIVVRSGVCESGINAGEIWWALG